LARLLQLIVEPPLKGLYGMGRGIVLLLNAPRDICGFGGDGLLQARQLHLEFVNPRISVTVFRCQLTELDLDLSLLFAKSLKRGRGSHGGQQFRVSGLNQVQSSLLDELVGPRFGELLVYELRSVREEFVLFVGTER